MRAHFLSSLGASRSQCHVQSQLTTPQFLAQVFTEKRPLDTVGASVVAKLFETVGLSLVLTWWGTRTNPFN